MTVPSSPGAAFGIDEPSVDRSVTLHFSGDWGTANFHRICGWLCQEFCRRAGPRSRVWIGNCNAGAGDALSAVHHGEVDLAVTTPTMVLHDALSGAGMYRHTPMPDLRALGVIPHRDMLVLALAADLGIGSFEDLRERRPALRLATSPDDGVNHLGFVARRFMEAEGVDEDALRSWGGEYVNEARPEVQLEMVRESLVDGVITEAIMAPWWRQIIEKRGPLAFISAEDRVLDELERTHGWLRRTLPADTFTGQPEPLVSLDYSHFLVFVRADMADDVAYLLTWCMVETRDVLERQYRHLDPDLSQVSYPLDPAKMGHTPLPLHPGAERYYRSAGLL